MILIIERDCPFCDEFKAREGLTLAEFIGDGKMVLKDTTLGDIEVAVPMQLIGLPTLVDGSHIYIGRDLIRDRLKDLPCAA